MVHAVSSVPQASCTCDSPLRSSSPPSPFLLLHSVYCCTSLLYLPPPAPPPPSAGCRYSSPSMLPRPPLLLRLGPEATPLRHGRTGPDPAAFDPADAGSRLPWSCRSRIQVSSLSPLPLRLSLSLSLSPNPWGNVGSACCSSSSYNAAESAGSASWCSTSSSRDPFFIILIRWRPAKIG